MGETCSMHVKNTTHTKLLFIILIGTEELKDTIKIYLRLKTRQELILTDLA